MSTTTTTEVDKFGIKMINPSTTVADRKREYYMNMDNPEADGIFDQRNANIVKRPDGSWASTGPEVRLYIYSPSPLPFWKNVELTGYFFIESGGSAATDAIQIYARGGIHTEQQYTLANGQKKWGMCMGSKLAARAYIGGEVRVVKEIGHSVYSEESRGRKKTNTYPNLISPRRWFGLKTTLTEYKTSSGGIEGVRIRLYIDDNAQDASTGNCQPKNNWKLLTEAFDDGTWNCDDGSTQSTVDTFKGLIDKCGVPPGMTRAQYAKMPLTWYGHPTFINDANNRKFANTASWRWDGIGVKFKYLSCREIIPP